MLRPMLCGATLIGGFFWGLYLVYGWWAFSSLLALGAMASIVRQGMIESLVSQTVAAVVLLGIGAALREPKVIRRRLKAGARRAPAAASVSPAGVRDSLQGIEHYDPLVDGAAAGDTVRMALIRKYRIRRDDNMGLIICEGQAFRSLDEALEHARQAEIEAKRQARAQAFGSDAIATSAGELPTLVTEPGATPALPMSGETGRSPETVRAAAGAIRELLRPGALADGAAAGGLATASPGGVPGRAGQRSVVPAA